MSVWLAGMACGEPCWLAWRFVIAHITDPAMVRTGLVVVVRALPSVAFQPLLKKGRKPFVEWETIKLYRNVLPMYRYGGVAELLAALPEGVIASAGAKVSELRALRLRLADN